MSKKKNRNSSHDEHIDETWLIPYADLLTLLLALFIVLFASSQIDAKKFDAIKQSFNEALNGGTGVLDYSSIIETTDSIDTGNKNDNDLESDKGQNRNFKDKESQMLSKMFENFNKETIELEKLQEQINEYISNNGLTSKLETKLNNDFLIINIQDNAIFDSGSAKVKPQSQKLASYISDILSSYPKYEVVIAGHTDNVPIGTSEFESNWELSSKRALNFMNFILKNDKLAPMKFSAVGYGEYRPIDSNDTKEGKAKNRRVEILIVRQANTFDIQ